MVNIGLQPFMTKISCIRVKLSGLRTKSDYGSGLWIRITDPDYGSELRIRIMDPNYGSGLMIQTMDPDQNILFTRKIIQITDQIRLRIRIKNPDYGSGFIIRTILSMMCRN